MAFLIVFLQRLAFDETHLVLEFVIFILLLGTGLILDFQINSLKKNAKIDHLTGLYNAEHFRYVTQKKDWKYISLLVIDVDLFKKYNDEHGHLKGNALLKIYGTLIREHFKDYGQAFRFGGEEFVILLRNVDNFVAEGLAESFRKRVESYEGLNTVSIGLASTHVGKGDVKRLFHLADVGMYKAKVTKNAVFNEGEYVNSIYGELE